VPAPTATKHAGRAVARTEAFAVGPEIDGIGIGSVETHLSRSTPPHVPLDTAGRADIRSGTVTDPRSPISSS
jgi:hypothetical protein